MTDKQLPNATELITRAVRNSRPRRPGKWVRWSCVGETFAVGSTTARALCRAYGVNPDDMMNGHFCELCNNGEDIVL